MKAVLYYFKNHNKINGSLFYCFEYFACAKKQNKDVKFIIFNISAEDFSFVLNIFKDKYVFDLSYLQDIEAINSIQELFKRPIEKALILDVHSLEKLHYFVKGDIVCFANEQHAMIRSELKKITYYGYYDYQPCDLKDKLKLNFEIFKPISNEKKGKVMVSSRLFNYDVITIPDEFKDMIPVYKSKSDHVGNMFEEIEGVFYFHSFLDTNNRLIPEAFFYKKKILIDFNGDYADSVYFRYKEITTDGLDSLTLKGDELMLKDFLGQV